MGVFSPSLKLTRDWDEDDVPAEPDLVFRNIKKLTILVEEEDVGVFFLLWWCFQKGVGVAIDTDRAPALYTGAARTESGTEYTRLGDCFGP